MSTPAVTSPEAPAPMSPVSRIINVFISPSTTFTDLKRNSSWWLAWLFIMVMSIPFFVAIEQKVGYEQLVRNQISTNRMAKDAMDKLSADQREQQIKTRAAFARYISYATPVLALIIYVVVAALLMGTFNFGVGTEVPFSLSLAVVVYSYLPHALRAILAAIALFAGANPEGFDPNNPIASNLGFFIDHVAHPAWYTFASWIDLFGIWIVILLGIGYSSVSKVKRSTAIGVVAGWYLLMALIFTGLTAAFS